MENKMSLIGTDADVELVCAAALSDEHIDHPMHTKPLKFDPKQYGKHASVMTTIAWRKMERLIAEEDLFFSKCSEAVFGNEMDKTLVKMLRLRNSPALKEIEPASARLLETSEISLFGPELFTTLCWNAQKDGQRLDTFMNAIVTRIISSPLFIWPPSGVIKQLVDAIIDKCRSTQLYAKVGKVNKKEYHSPRPNISWTQRKSPEIHASAKAANIEGLRKINDHRDGLEFWKEWMQGRAPQGLERLRTTIGLLKKAMKQEAHNFQDYPVHQTAHLDAETQWFQYRLGR